MEIRRGSRTVAAILLAMGVLLAGSACAEPRGRIYVRVGPPVPIVEAAFVAPGPAYVWTPGFYRWDGAAYLWSPGRYVLPPRPRSVWVPGRWVRERGGWYFIGGHWR
jgi:hypothetical protein